MTRENITKAIGDISDKYLVEAMDGISDTVTERPNEVIEMKKFKSLKTVAAAVAVCIMIGGLGTGAYAAMLHFGILDFAGPATIEVSDPDSIQEVTNEVQKENNTIFECDVVETMIDEQNITVVYEVSAKDAEKYLFVPEDADIKDIMRNWGYSSEQTFEEYASEKNLSIVFIGGGILNRDEMGIAVVTMDFKNVDDDTIDVFFTCGIEEKPKTSTINIVTTGHFQGDKEAMRLESSFKLER